MQTKILVALAAALAIVGCGGEVQNPVNEQLRQEALKLNARLGEREQENQTLNQKVAEHEREKAVLNAKLDETSSVKECANEAPDSQLGERLAATELENQELKRTHEQELAKNQTEIEELKTKLERHLASQCDSHDSAREKLQAENKTLQEQLTTRIAEQDRLKALTELEIEELKAKLERNLASQGNEQGSEREKLQAENKSLQEQLTIRLAEHDRLKTLSDELSDPLEQFKRLSKEYVSNLKPRKLFGDRRDDDCKTFIRKLAWLGDPRRLTDLPTALLKASSDGAPTLTLPLPLVFDSAPKLNMPISLYVSYKHGAFSAERNAQFLLATDDKDILRGQSWEFKVPASFPLIYLGKRVFMLPKVLFDPMYASKKSIKFISLEYAFNDRLNQPRGLEIYVKSLEEFQAQSEIDKHRALEDRQAEIDTPLDDSHEFDDDFSEV